MALTRRQFLTRIAAAGGAPLVYEAMTGLGLLAAPARQTGFELAGRVSNVRVLVLGAGITGLTVAYQLGKAGYDCRVLEAARGPAAGSSRCAATRSSEEDGPGQTAAFDDGLYFNAGPMRISHHHHTTLAYCRELQVPTEVFVPDCESAYLAQTRGPLAGRRIRLREARADFDGYLAELLSKALSQTQLDQPLTAEDRDRVLGICAASAPSISSASIAARRGAASTTMAGRPRRWRSVTCSAGFPTSMCRPTGPPSRR